MVKQCRKCKEDKPLSDFHKHPTNKGGLQAYCKACSNLARRAYQRKYHYKPQKGIKKKLWADPKSRAMLKAWKEKFHKERPQEARAQWKLQAEVKLGRIKRGNCEQCGQPNAHAHHDDYSKPLEVRWLCNKHHRELHRKLKEKTA